MDFRAQKVSPRHAHLLPPPAFNPEQVGKNHVYGAPLVRDAYGVGACTSNWDISKAT